MMVMARCRHSSRPGPSMPCKHPDFAYRLEFGKPGSYYIETLTGWCDAHADRDIMSN